jgi:hypothetical protein
VRSSEAFVLFLDNSRRVANKEWESREIGTMGFTPVAVNTFGSALIIIALLVQIDCASIMIFVVCIHTHSLEGMFQRISKCVSKILALHGRDFDLCAHGQFHLFSPCHFHLCPAYFITLKIKLFLSQHALFQQFTEASPPSIVVTSLLLDSCLGTHLG